MKDSSFYECVATVRAVASGDRILPPMTDTLVAHIAKEASERKAQDVLEDVRMTPTELEVIELVGEGLSNKEIAEITVNTGTDYVVGYLSPELVAKKLVVSVGLEP